nr:hypothetical protein Itr_chr10CG13590 [Ipomoea trifida]
MRSSGGGRWQEGRRGSRLPARGLVGFGGGTSVAGRTCGLKRRASAAPRDLVVVFSGSDSPYVEAQAETCRRRSAGIAFARLRVKMSISELGSQ